MAAFIFAIVVSVRVEFPERMFGRQGLRRKGPAGDISYSTQELHVAMTGSMRGHRERVSGPAGALVDGVVQVASSDA